LRDGIADAKKGRKYRLQDNDLILPSSLKIARGLQVDPELAKRTHVFLDAVMLPPSRGLAEELHRKLSTVSADVKRWLLVIGKLSARKRQTDAVKVLRSLLDRGHTDFGLALAGDCDEAYAAEMRTAIREAKVEDRVVMLGNFSDIRALFALEPIGLLTSLREALPGSVMETLLAGRPCFMYPCEGAEDIFGPYQDGFVSAGFDPEQLTQKIDCMLRDPQQCAAQVKELQQRAENLFSPAAHLQALKDRLCLDLRPGARTSPQ
jgi:glycosyltransferase involved in cell wall biosynthesis